MKNRHDFTYFDPIHPAEKWAKGSPTACKQWIRSVHRGDETPPAGFEPELTFDHGTFKMFNWIPEDSGAK